MFLAIVKKTVIDVAEVVEDLAADPPVAAVAEVSHLEVEQSYIEDASSQIAINLNNGLPIDYYEIQFNGAQLQATLHPVSLKAGPRSVAPAQEVVEVEAAGQDVGSAVVNA